MANKKYIDFPTGTYDTSKIFLQANPTTGELQKVNLPFDIIASLITQYLRGDRTWQTLNTLAVIELTNLYFTNARARAALALTTTGTSGAATYDPATGIWNIPNYAAEGSSQWITSGANISYSAGKVGIGMSPIKTLDVLGDIKASADLYSQGFELLFNGGSRVIKTTLNDFNLQCGTTNVLNLTTTGIYTPLRYFLGNTQSFPSLILKGTLTLPPVVGVQGPEILAGPTSNSVVNALIIRGTDYAYGNSATAPISVYMYGGKNTFASTFGNVILAHDGTTQRGKVAIGTITPAASAVLDVTSTDKGILFPRMTTAQKNAIVTPTAGLVIYDTTLNKLCVYTTAWQTITST
jgi:hypothetical protein